MNLEYIEDLINSENINLIDTYLQDTAGAYVNYEEIYAILYDSKKLETSYKKKEVLMEELGHYYTDSTYKFTSDREFVQKQEYRAKKWSYFMLVPKDALLSAIQNGKKDCFALADYFGVTVEYIINAIDFYVEKYGYITNDKVLN